LIFERNDGDKHNWVALLYQVQHNQCAPGVNSISGSSEKPRDSMLAKVFYLFLQRHLECYAFGMILVFAKWKAVWARAGKGCGYFNYLIFMIH